MGWNPSTSFFLRVVVGVVFLFVFAFTFLPRCKNVFINY